MEIYQLVVRRYGLELGGLPLSNNSTPVCVVYAEIECTYDW
jgi:hypothetical protein